MKATEVFVTSVHDRQRFDVDEGGHPTRIRVWGGEALTLEADASHFIFVHEGQATLVHDDACFCLKSSPKSLARRSTIFNSLTRVLRLDFETTWRGK